MSTSSSASALTRRFAPPRKVAQRPKFVALQSRRTSVKGALGIFFSNASNFSLCKLSLNLFWICYNVLFLNSRQECRNVTKEVCPECVKKIVKSEKCSDKPKEVCRNESRTVSKPVSSTVCDKVKVSCRLARSV